MKITRIELQKNDNTRFNLFSGDEYIMSASVDNLKDYSYGEFEISEEDLKALMEKEDIEKAYNKAIRYVSKSLKTTKEVRDYLYKHKVPANFHDEVIKKLEDIKLLDDKRYLEIYLEEKFNYSTDGPMKIKSKLYQKGFSSQDVDPYLEQYRNQEEDNLRKAIEIRLRSKKNEDKNKLIRYLLSKGFDYSSIKDVIGDYYKDDC